MKEDMGSRISINWRYFSLEQVNNRQGPGWRIWEQSEDHSSRGLAAFRAAEVARRQGGTAFDAFHMALLRAKREQGQDIADEDILCRVAEVVGLEMARFRKDLADPQILTRLAEDHTFAVDTLAVFGTPTLVFPENQAVFLKMSPPSPEESLSVFDEVRTFAERRPHIQEIKRPQPRRG
ncbi:MAG: DsbA family protein [Dehalococcoidales bacterium]|nr:DsbA family protein [Dehalococcoidales bacterium]